MQVNPIEWKTHDKPVPYAVTDGVLLIKYGEVVNCFQEIGNKWGIIENNQWYELKQHLLIQPYKWLFLEPEQ
jgi:hypothetical protein